ncbi:MAG: TraB/GumN family protein, partial [Gammaproteobacteria bacterium]|nr:TraB/GumN family protein [Gammaproteobacteria bacterium]
MRRYSPIPKDSSTTLLRFLPGFILSLLLVLLPGSGVLHAAMPAAQSGALAVPETASRFNKGLLWKIDAPGTTASFIFGTIHSDDKRVTTLPEPVTRSLNASERFVMEAIVDGDALVRMAEVMFFNDGRTLEQVIGRKLYMETVAALTA